MFNRRETFPKVSRFYSPVNPKGRPKGGGVRIKLRVDTVLILTKEKPA
jgi:hypothetical protein